MPGGTPGRCPPSVPSTTGKCSILRGCGTTKLAARPTAKTVDEPTRANHGKASGVPNLAIDHGGDAPASTPTSAAVCPTRRVRIPSRNSPSRMPETSAGDRQGVVHHVILQQPGAEGHGRQDEAPDHRHHPRDPHQVPLVVPAGEGPVQVVDDRRGRRVQASRPGSPSPPRRSPRSPGRARRSAGSGR